VTEVTITILLATNMASQLNTVVFQIHAQSMQLLANDTFSALKIRNREC